MQLIRSLSGRRALAVLEPPIVVRKDALNDTLQHILIRSKRREAVNPDFDSAGIVMQAGYRFF